jgi:ParB-like chromosome segregation protein Spo0J
MARVSSAPQDAAKSASASKPESASLYLVPSQILRTKGNDFARPGPKPPDEQKSIEALARDLRNIGQIVPLVVGEPDIAGLYPLIDGKRRLDAAELLTQESGVDFPLQCVIRSGVMDDYLQAAIHANIKRRGLTALQLAYLIKELRAMHGWTGTAEVAAYLGVSRAQVSQHDKLLKRPDGMPKAAYDALLTLLQAGRAGAETAFYTLTHVEPAAAGQVLDRAQIIAEAEREQKSALTHAKDPATPPAKRQGAQRVDKTETEPVKTHTHKWTKQNLVTIRDKTGMYDELECESPEGCGAHARRYGLGEIREYTPKEPKPEAKVEKKHVRQAAQESRAIKEQTQRTVPELRALFEKLRAPSYPDIMRGFISVLAGQWWAGAEPDDAVLTRWTRIATLVEESLERSHGCSPEQHPYGPRKKRAPSLEEKKKLYSRTHR